MQNPRKLISVTESVVRFSECDPLGMVWHGNYIKYFEDGREDFGRKYTFGYWDIYKQEGLAVPLVNVECNFKKFLNFGESIKIETTFHETPAAKIMFDYKVFNQAGELACTGNSIQVFFDVAKKQLLIINPSFYESWKNTFLK